MCVHACNALLFHKEKCQSDGWASKVSVSSSIVLIAVLSKRKKLSKSYTEIFLLNIHWNQLGYHRYSFYTGPNLRSSALLYCMKLTGEEIWHIM